MIHVVKDRRDMEPQRLDTAKTLCGLLVVDVIEAGGAIGVAGRLDPEMDICATCVVTYVKGI